MNRKLYSFVVIGALTGLAFGATATQGRQANKTGPYRVVLSKPIAPGGHRVGDAYTEHEQLTGMFDELHKQGLTPVFTELLRIADEREFPVERLLVVCVEK